MTEQYRQVAKTYLIRNGYAGRELEVVLSGFDWASPAYEQQLDHGAILYQFMRRASHGTMVPGIGNWFCLPGATLSSLAIMSGGEGRSLAKVRVKFPLVALEGTASRQAKQWSWSGGGPGGATQIFVPSKFLFTHLDILGVDTDLRDIASA
jgi:hypothetical protein